MDDLRYLVKEDKAVKEEALLALSLVVYENYATKSALLYQKIVDNAILARMIKLAGDEMMDLLEDNKTKDTVISEYEKVVGYAVVNAKILNTAKLKFNQSYDTIRVGTKTKLLERLLVRAEKCIQQS